MPEMPKESRDENKDQAKTASERTWSEDQNKKPYYYDDACGYETYVPDDDEHVEQEEIDL
jgi:hypothetical protein